MCEVVWSYGGIGYWLFGGIWLILLAFSMLCCTLPWGASCFSIIIAIQDDVVAGEGVPPPSVISLVPVFSSGDPTVSMVV